MLTKSITLKPASHRGERIIQFYFDFDQSLIALCKQIGCKWSQNEKCWYLYDHDNPLPLIFKTFKGVAWIDYTHLKKKQSTRERTKRDAPLKHFSEEVKIEITRFDQLLGARGYAKNTRSTYKNMLEVFFGYFKEKQPNEISNEDVNEFLHEFNVGRGYSASYLRQMIGALKLFYEKRKGIKLFIDKLELPKKRRQLPKVLSLEEVGAILDNLKNLKHKAMISLQYGCGLRVGELLNLKPEHIDKDRHTLMILNGKGRVDRRVRITDSLLELLRDYYKAYRPSDYLFEGQNGGQYSDRSVNLVLKRAAQAAGVTRNVSSHMLRHSYATHLLEGGVDLRFIQELLGHKSSKTTEIYTYVSNKKLESLPSPFDFLKRNNE